MRQLKPALTLSEQVDRLVERGMIVEDRDEALRILGEINYYRFTGYAFLFQKENDHYHKGTSFAKIVQLIQFDSELRNVLMDALENIEIYARARIAHIFSLAHNRDGGAYYDPAFAYNKDFHQEFLDDLKVQISKNAQQPFVAHHINEFDGRMPLWCTVEILPFSRLSKLYSNMLNADKDLIAANMDTDAPHLTNWLHCFSVLRNSCAHYCRLYQNVCNPSVSIDPKFYRLHKEVFVDSLFACIFAMLRIMPRIEWKHQFRDNLFKLIEKYDKVDLKGIGFPPDWKDILLDDHNITLPAVAPEKKYISNLPPLPDSLIRYEKP